MKIKIGTITEDVLRMTNDIFKTSTHYERLSIQLKNTNKSVSEVDEMITANFTGSLIFIDEGKEENFDNYIFESVSKSYDDAGKLLTIEFKKQEDIDSETEI